MADVTARYLLDKSALERMRLPPVRDRLGPIIEAGVAATCSMVDLEVLFSGRNAREHPIGAFPAAAPVLDVACETIPSD